MARATPFPWRRVMLMLGLAILIVSVVVSKRARRELLGGLGMTPHDALRDTRRGAPADGWSDRFDREAELAQFTGNWLPQNPGERGCTWSIRGVGLTRTCNGTTEVKRLQIDGPGSLLSRPTTAGGWARFGYARIGDRIYVGVGATGKRFGDIVILDDPQVRVVRKGEECLAYRTLLVVGGYEREWEPEPTRIACSLTEDRFDYQTVTYRMGSGWVWVSASVKVNGDALFEATIEQFPLLPSPIAASAP